MVTLIGSTSHETAGSGGLTAALSVTVTGADQSILVWVSQQDSLTRTFTVTSSLDGSLGAAVSYYNPGAAVGAWVLHDASVGTHTISVTASVSGVGFGASAQVVEDLGRDTPVVDTQFASVNGASHVSGGTGVSTSASAFVLCVCALSGNVTTKVAGSGYTLATGPAATSARVSQYQDFATGITLEQGAFTTTGVQRANRGLIIAFPAVSGGGGGSASSGGFISWFGR